MNQSSPFTLAHLQVHYDVYSIDKQANKLTSALLRLGYGVEEVNGNEVEDTTLLVINFKFDPRFFEKLTRLVQHFGAGSVNPTDVGVSEKMRTYNKEERGARMVIAQWGDQVLRECGLLQRDEAHVLDKDTGLRLAYFIRSAVEEVQQY